MQKSLLHYRIALIISLIIIVPLGYMIRFTGDGWLNDFLGGVAYEIFLVLLIALVFPKLALGKVAIAVLLATCLLEFLQLWQNPVYQAAQSTFMGRLVLGNTFVWSDFPNYFVGAFAGWLWARSLLLCFRRQK